MRTGAEYREALRDGRRVWVMGEGWAGDVTAHPATRAMVEEYAAWYDRHIDPAWEEVLLAPADGDGKRVPWAYRHGRIVMVLSCGVPLDNFDLVDLERRNDGRI